MRHKLDAREYKLLLNPSRFGKPLSDASANAFWRGEIEPIIANRLDQRDDDSPRFAKAFDTPFERIVRFWDTRNCALTAADLALRSRSDARSSIERSERQEITLKLRMADYFVVANTLLPGVDAGAVTRFEEDIGPLEVKPDDPTSAVVFPAKHSIRSRFSLSTRLIHDWRGPLPTVGRLRHLFPTLEALLEQPVEPDSDEILVAGPLIHELAAKGAEVRLGEGVTGRFTLTFWYFGPAEGSPTVAEMSFKCATIDGEMPGKAAHRALDLFVGLQADLGDYVNTDHSSKTAMALPQGCISRG
ncbi:hypothetical protein AB3480_30755 [Rhizobium mongolense]|uniref:hypothetical protein n=1 Tax=Rhizobium mongolense TaxID=57676 RepID=UPI0034A2BF4A